MEPKSFNGKPQIYSNEYGGWFKWTLRYPSKARYATDGYCEVSFLTWERALHTLGLFYKRNLINK